MPTNFKELADGIGAAFKTRSERHFLASYWVKAVLVGGGALAAGISQFVVAADKGWSAPILVGIIGVFAVTLGGLFLTITDSDASKELETARVAVALAKDASDELRNLDQYQRESDRAVVLYTAMNTMRGIIERSIGGSQSDLTKVLEGLLEASKRLLLIALDFKLVEHWTLCIYVAEQDAASQKTVLRCIAQERTLPRKLDEARRWPEGVGVAGIAYSLRREVIVPDLTAAELGTLYNLGEKARDDDAQRYKSIVAVPILVGQMDKCWGVVVATSDYPNHFQISPRTGVHTAEAVRGLAGMVALAVRVHGGALANREPTHATVT